MPTLKAQKVNKRPPSTSSMPIKGVRQGCPVSLPLFNPSAEDIFREIDSEDQNDNYEGEKIGGMTITDLRYADDLSLLSRSTKGLNSIIQKDKAISELKYGLRINDKKKTKF